STTPGGGAGGAGNAPTLVASCANPVAVQPAAGKPYAFDPSNPALGAGLIPGFEDPVAGYAWEGRWQERPVSFRSTTTGALLHGTVFAPNPLPARPVPGIAIVPGS